MRLNEFTNVAIVERFPLGGNFKSDTLYFNKVIQMVKYVCPCGTCKQTEALAIAEHFDRVNRYWEIHINEGKATIEASVGSGNPCKSHYFIRDNKIIWL